MGKIGNIIRNNAFPYLDYFSLFRADEILLFRAIKENKAIQLCVAEG